ncbi:MAG TPA: FAD-dependent oxidoreductase [Candidatus Saccharimonadales bacterium]|nr:FAD-dependent oxidoreductase [Candidatus Saccharimonadales bacterium]
MIVHFDHSEALTPNITSFYFRPTGKIQQVAGQFTEIHLPHAQPDDRGEKRWFTLSNSPTESMLAITTRHAAEHGSTFKEALWALKPGTELSLADPMGDMVLPKDPKRPLLFVAGGMGITPMRSMLKWLLDTHEQRPIRLLHAVQKAEDLIFASLFKEYSMDYTPIVSTPAPDWTGEQGRLTPERMLQSAQSDQALIYLSGPEPMVEVFEKGLKDLGVAPERILTDSFPGYSVI